MVGKRDMSFAGFFFVLELNILIILNKTFSNSSLFPWELNIKYVRFFNRAK